MVESEEFFLNVPGNSHQQFNGKQLNQQLQVTHVEQQQQKQIFEEQEHERQEIHEKELERKRRNCQKIAICNLVWSSTAAAAAADGDKGYHFANFDFGKS